MSFNKPSVCEQVPEDAGDRRPCAVFKCRYPVPTHRRRYCDVHGPQASKLRKAEVRRQRIAEYKAARLRGERPPSPHLHGWVSREDYNAYMKEVMRRYRAQKKAQAGGSSAGSTTTAVFSAIWAGASSAAHAGTRRTDTVRRGVR